MKQKAADVWFRRIFMVAVIGALAGIAYAFVRMNAGAFTRPSDIHVDHPEIAVRDARSLIAMKNANPEAFSDVIDPEKLPHSLQIHALRYAKIHADHIDLVIARNPDVSLGARIWTASHRMHHDVRTRYADIYLFRYDNDLPASISNIP